MNSPRATAVFAIALAARELVEIIESVDRRPTLWIALLIVTAVTTVAFWTASRRSTYRWYSAAVAGFVTSILLTSLYHWLIQFGWATALAVGCTAMVIFPVLLARVFREQEFKDQASSSP
jgi:predicted PurR-regulated permease PerM